MSVAFLAPTHRNRQRVAEFCSCNLSMKHRKSSSSSTDRSMQLPRPALVFLGVVVLSMLGAAIAQTTNPTDLEVLYEVMYSMNYEYDWKSYFPDPCVSGPQGIGCEADAETGVYYVTQMQFGYISPIANLIPCSDNATIPASIVKLTRIDTLFFYSCFVNATTTIPAEVAALGPTLRLLSFNGNPGLVGPIPAGLGNLKGLQRLVLSQNSLQGSIPDDLGSLSSLMQLDLSHNNLTGAVPGSLGSLSSLVNLDLRYNQLNGEFPLPLAQGLTQLQRMALSYNMLTGGLPDAFTGLPSLTFLDLSYNQLGGTLPPSLGGLAALEDLFLNSNADIGGALPASLGGLRNLVRLDLSNCNFVGTIPDAFKDLSSLRFLSVSNNRLSGPIPPSLAALPHIFTLNLDGNQLSGPVPFPPTFVQRMGRNMALAGNPGLCYTPQISIKAPIGLSRCPESAKSITAAAPGALAPSPSAAAALELQHLSNTLFCALASTTITLVYNLWL